MIFVDNFPGGELQHEGAVGVHKEIICATGQIKVGRGNRLCRAQELKNVIFFTLRIVVLAGGPF